MSKPPAKFRRRRRIVLAAEIIGLFLIVGPGLTSDRSGLPYIATGLCMLAFSFVLRLYCGCADRKAWEVEPTHENAE